MFTPGGEQKMRPEIQRILSFFDKCPEVASLYIFGSFDTPRERSDSDIDIAVLIRPEEARDVRIKDLRTKYYSASPGFSMRTVDIVILNAAPTFLRYQVLKTGRILMDKDPAFRKAFSARVLQEYFDYRPIEETYLKKLSARIRERYHGRPESHRT